MAIAIRNGWSDGQRKSASPTHPQHYLMRYAPRPPRDPWSRRAVVMADKLIAEGTMTPAGLKEVKKAKENGQWARSAGLNTDEDVPKDMQMAIRERGIGLVTFWNKLTRCKRAAFVLKVELAEGGELRANRIKWLVQLMAEGKTTL